MTPTTNKLEKVQADLYDPHDLFSQFGSIYDKILMFEYI